MDRRLREVIEDCPIINAVKDDQGLLECLKTDSKVVFVLFGDICSIGSKIERVKDAGKMAFVHIDLITGLSSKEVSVEYIKQQTRADGIITTKPLLVKKAKELGLYTILRFFVIDSMAYNNIDKQVGSVKPDLIEVLPGVMPKVIARICKITHIPVIAGGLIEDKEDIMAALEAGAVSISTTNSKVWFM